MSNDKESNQGHWEGLKADPYHYLGFIYRIEHVDGGAYIGRRQYHYIKQPRKRGCKTLVTDKSSPKWKPSCWVESDWREYTGSSKKFNEFIEQEGKDKFRFEIIKQCHTKAHLHYAEVEALVEYGVLWKKNTEGRYIYFNRQIPATRFRVANYGD